MNRKTPATKAVVRQRIEDILRIRLDGAELWDVCEFVREKAQEAGSAWHLLEGQKPLSDSQLRRYMAAADKRIAESCRASRKKLMRRHLAQRRNLYAKAVSQGDLRAALAAADSEAKLLGLFAPTKTELTGKAGTPLYPSLEAMVAALMRVEQGGETPDASDDVGSPAGNRETAPGSETQP